MLSVPGAIAGSGQEAMPSNRPSIALLMAAVLCIALQAMQQTCRLFYGLLANPTTTTTWGRLVLVSPSAKLLSDFLRLSRWVQRRLKGELYMMNVRARRAKQPSQQQQNNWKLINK